MENGGLNENTGWSKVLERLIYYLPSAGPMSSMRRFSTNWSTLGTSTIQSGAFGWLLDPDPSRRNQLCRVIEMVTGTAHGAEMGASMGRNLNLGEFGLLNLRRKFRKNRTRNI